MGLLTSVNNLNYTLEEEKKAKKLEKIQKQKEKIRKEDLNRYKKELENFIKIEFTKYFSIAGTSYIYEFYNRERKKEILNNYFDTIATQDKNGFYTIPFKIELEEHFYNKYTIILNKCLKEQKQQEIYNTTIESQKIQIEEEKPTKSSNFTSIFLAILITTVKIGLCIIFFPIIFILLILFGVMKSM